jgi:hypothetical protein
MDAKTYLKLTIVNLIFLGAGIAIGRLHVGPVYAQGITETGQEFENVTPQFSAGSAAFGTLLAGKFAVDQMTVQGVDLLAFDQNLLNLLASKGVFFGQDELRAVIQKSRPPIVLRMKTPEAAKQEPPPPKKEK